MKETQIINEAAIRRIENDLEILAAEMAKLCVPPRTSRTELRLRRSHIFGRLGDGVVWIDVYERADRLGREFEMEVRDRTFEPGNAYGLQQIWAPDELRGEGSDVLIVQLFLSDMRAELVKSIREAFEPEDESA